MKTTLINLARGLVSEEGENPEYDRGVTELVCDALGVSIADHRAEVGQLIGVKPQAIEAWGENR